MGLKGARKKNLGAKINKKCRRVTNPSIR